MSDENVREERRGCLLGADADLMSQQDLCLQFFKSYNICDDIHVPGLTHMHSNGQLV